MEGKPRAKEKEVKESDGTKKARCDAEAAAAAVDMTRASGE